VSYCDNGVAALVAVRRAEILSYQLTIVMSWITMAFTGDGGCGSDPGEGA